jgi:hypothetical protein
MVDSLSADEIRAAFSKHYFPVRLWCSSFGYGSTLNPSSKLTIPYNAGYHHQFKQS